MVPGVCTWPSVRSISIRSHIRPFADELAGNVQVFDRRPIEAGERAQIAEQPLDVIEDAWRDGDSGE